MSVTLFVCVVILTTIGVNNSITIKNESTENYVSYNNKNISIKPETANEHPGGAAINTKVTNNDKNSTQNVTKDPKTSDTQAKNRTENTDKDGIGTASSQTVISYPTYEVTEDFSDIPDNRTLAGPIVPYYTIKPPLNLGKPDNNTEKDKTTESNIKNKRNRVSIVHINAEFDNKNEVQDNKVVGLFKSIKEYIYGFNRGIINGIQGFFHKFDSGHENLKGRTVDEEEDYEESDSEEIGNVDKTEYYVKRRHISVT